MTNRNYPIILGHDFRKGYVVVKKPDEKRASLIIVRLKKDYPSGEEFDPKDIESAEVELIFCNREAIKTLVDVLQRVLDDMQ